MVLVLVAALVFGVIGVAIAGGTAEAQSGPQYNDGTYYAQSELDGRMRQGVLEITIMDGEIIGAHYDEIERNEDGEIVMHKLGNHAYAENWRGARDYDTSQFSAFPAYVNQLVAGGSPDEVDLVTGATSSYETFIELAEEVLERASR